MVLRGSDCAVATPVVGRRVKNLLLGCRDRVQRFLENHYLDATYDVRDEVVDDCSPDSGSGHQHPPSHRGED